MDTAERLMRGLGFTGYESRFKVALTRRHPANGYEIGKLSGVPTSKVYATLEGLRNGGFIVADETRSPIKYDPVPISEIASRLRSAHEDELESLEGELRRIAPLPEPELEALRPEIHGALGRGLRVVVACFGRAEGLGAVRSEMRGEDDTVGL